MRAPAGEGRVDQGVNAGPVVAPPLATSILEIVAIGRQRRALHKAEKVMILMRSAKERSYALERRRAAGVEIKRTAEGKFKFPPVADFDREAVALAFPELMVAEETLRQGRLKREKELEKLAKRLPVHDWWTSIRGCGPLGLVAVVAEAGDLSNYDTWGRVWKRLGLAVDGGHAQRLEKGGNAGYNPERRSAIWTISDAMLRSQVRAGRDAEGVKDDSPSVALGEYGQVYIDRKAREVARNEAGEFASQAADRLKRWGATKAEARYWRQGRLAPGHIDKRARRYAEKCLIRDLWQAWRAAGMMLKADYGVPPANLTPKLTA